MKVKKLFRGEYWKHPSEPCWNAVCIPSTQDRHILIDIEDYEAIADKHWQVTKGWSTYYAHTNIKRDGRYTFVKLHRYLLNPESVAIVGDHVNGNGLDNRRCNIRLATRSENIFNRTGNLGATSKYKGVAWHKPCKLWRTQLRYNGKRYYEGYFKSEEEAAKAYDVVALRVHGEFARLNFPLEPQP